MNIEKMEKKANKQKMSINEDKYREKIWEILNTIQANQLYVHSASLDINDRLKTKYGVSSIELIGASSLRAAKLY